MICFSGFATNNGGICHSIKKEGKSIKAAYLSLGFVLLLWPIILIDATSAGSASTTQSSISTADSTTSGVDWLAKIKKDHNKFLIENVFGQKKESGFVNEQKQDNNQNQESSSSLERGVNDGNNKNSWKLNFDFLHEGKKTLDAITAVLREHPFAKTGSEQDNEKKSKLLDVVAEEVTEGIMGKENQRDLKEVVELFGKAIYESVDFLKRTDIFDEVMENFISHFRLHSLWYYLRKEEIEKNSVWKRRSHYYYPTINDVEVFKQLHAALYLSNLAYADTNQQVYDGITKFENNTWEVLYVTTQELPKEPAHFIMIRKHQDELKKRRRSFCIFGRRNKPNDYLEIVIAIRGTKGLGDLFSDILIEEKDYRGYKAHGGILESGMSIVNKHVDKLDGLLRISGRKSIKLWVIGHSLGAGSAAIAAIEFANRCKFISSCKSVGFGTPSVLSPELSTKYKDMITTIISDADLVPRLSGPAVANLLLDIMGYDWTDEAANDVGPFLEELRTKIPLASAVITKTVVKDLLSWVKDSMKATVQEVKARSSAFQQRRLPIQLVPPGTCLHIFRNGPSYTASYTPCDFFNQIEFVPTLIDDHSIPSGYHKIMLNLARDITQDYNFDFDHDVLNAY